MYSGLAFESTYERRVAEERTGTRYEERKRQKEKEKDLPGHGKAGEKFRVVGCTHPPTREQKRLDVLSRLALSVDSLLFRLQVKALIACDTRTINERVSGATGTAKALVEPMINL